ncbi:MAG: thiamine ABC transporter substrate-binding protein [Promicromonosporaceae bacterium]|nr:thiamine ABC transporter substrate-binding protein [Promicromonosporaceae bacterium]
MSHPKIQRFAATLGAIALALAAGGCGTDGETATAPAEQAVVDPAEHTPADPDAAETAAPAELGGTVTLITHNSFHVDEELLWAFEDETGLTVEHLAIGNAAVLTNQVALTAGSPLGDVVFGIDSNFAGRVLDAGALEPFLPGNLPTGVERYLLFAGDDEPILTPIARGDVCINYDLDWFAAAGIAPPATFADLTNPEFRDLLVVMNPVTSSPGLAFLLATIAEFGEDGGWRQFWADLREGGVRVAESWSLAYNSEFTATSPEGTHPIIVSYASSPAFTLNADETATTTAALTDTCFQQIEYAGLLRGAANPDGGRALLEWLLTPDFQAGIPGSMWIWPIDPAIAPPADWAAHAARPAASLTLPPELVEANRDAWLDQWTETVLD